jgi:hypothetical protein
VSKDEPVEALARHNERLRAFASKPGRPSLEPPPACLSLSPRVMNIRCNPHGGKVFGTRLEARTYQTFLRSNELDRSIDYFIAIVGRERFRVARYQVGRKKNREFLNYM